MNDLAPLAPKNLPEAMQFAEMLAKSNIPKNSVDKIRLLLDDIEESILRASDEEIAEETRSAGKDPEALADQVGSLIQSGIKSHLEGVMKDE